MREDRASPPMNIHSSDDYVEGQGGNFAPLLDDTRETSAVFTGEPGNTYHFYSVATDLVGHIENAPIIPSATVTLLGRDAPPTVEIEPLLSDIRSEPLGDISIAFSEPVTGFDLWDLTLTRTAKNTASLLPEEPTGPGQPPNPSVATLTTVDGKNWVLGNLETLTWCKAESTN